jgi:hypothetical protein
MKLMTQFIALGALLSGSGTAGAAKQDADDLHVQHVLLISVDGLHHQDLDAWAKSHPASSLAYLAHHGVVYSGARTTTPSDSFPGLLALVTGGTPKTTGVYYDDSYDRTLYAPGSNCAGAPGTEIVYDESIDKDLNQLFSGGIAETNLPLSLASGVCKPVYPHEFIKVNTIFEVLHEAGRTTAWSDKHPAYDIVNGPSGKGVEDLYTPEINSLIANGGVVAGIDLAGSINLCDGVTNSLPLSKVSDYSTCIPAMEAYDDVKVAAVLNEIGGKRSDGSAGPGVPAVFGMNFQAVSVGQKLPVGGYQADGTPTAALAGAIAHTDASLAKLIEALHQRGLWNRTMVIVSAKHGQSPIERSKLAMEGAAQAAITDVQDPLPFINAVDPGVENTVFHDVTQTNGAKDYVTGGHLQTDDVGILWLQNQSPANVSGIVAQLSAHAADIHASVLPQGTIFSSNIVVGPALSAIFGDPSIAGSIAAARAPNVFIQPNEGVIYSGSSKKIAEHGGGAPGDTGVALVVAGGRIARGEVCESVMTTQVAPTILEALGFPRHRLEAVRQEKTEVLPGLDLR